MRTKSPTVRVLVGTAVAGIALLVTAACGSGSGSGSKMDNAGSAGNAAASGAPAGGGNAAASGAAGMDAGSPSAGGMNDAKPVSVMIVETKAGGADHYAFNPTTAEVADDQLTIVNKSDEVQKVTCTGGPAAAAVTVAAGKTGVLKFHGDGKYNCATNKGAKISVDVA